MSDTPAATAVPLPATIRLFGTYTAHGDQWNFGGADDPGLMRQITKVGDMLGATPNVYEVFGAWGTPYDFGGNTSWTVWAMMNSGFQGIPLISYRAHNGDNNPYGWGDTRALDDYAAGMFDDTLKAMIDGVYDSGCRFVIFRFNYEGNFDFMPYAMGWSEEWQQTKWKACMDHVYGLCRDYARSAHPDMVWLNAVCFAMGRGGQPSLSVYPDPALWDIYAPDFYGTYYGDGSKENPDDRKQFWLSGASGYENPWVAVTQFCLDHNKPLFLSESGCGGPAGINNDPEWADWLADRVVEFRAKGGKWWGLCQWDIPAGDGHWYFSDGGQPDLVAGLKRRMSDLLGDEISTTDPLGGVVDPPDPVDPPIDPPPVEPPPVDPNASPDGATATAPGTVLTSAGGNRFELVAMDNPARDYGIATNGTLDPVTHDVVMLYAQAGAIYQQAADGYWYKSDDHGGWSGADDPTGGIDPPIDPPVEPPAGITELDLLTAYGHVAQVTMTTLVALLEKPDLDLADPADPSAAADLLAQITAILAPD